MTDAIDQLIVAPLPSIAPEIGRALWMMEDTRNDTLQALRDLSPGALDALPEGAINTIGTLLYHTALVEASWLYEDSLEQPIPSEWDPLFPVDSRDEQRILSKMQGFGLDTYLHRLAVVRERLLAEFGAMTIEEYRRVRRPAGAPYDVTPEWALHHLMQHEAEHRGHIQMLAESARHDSGR